MPPPKSPQIAPPAPGIPPPPRPPKSMPQHTREVPPVMSMPYTQLSMEPVSHTFPQAPQLLSSLATQCASQQISPRLVPAAAAQTSVPQRHMLSVQVVPSPQTVPHAPQLASSAVVLMHEPPQQVVPVPQTVAVAPEPHVHIPPTQISSRPHACPGAPQLLGSVPVSTQANVAPVAMH